MIKYMVKAYLMQEADPGKTLTRVNAVAGKHLGPDEFVTALVLILEFDQKKMTFANAGHYQPVVCGDRCNCLQKDSGAEEPPLGILPEFLYTNTGMSASGINSILLYTDGLIDARDEKGRRFGEAGVIKSCKDARASSAQGSTNRVAGAALDHAGGSLSDDLALVTISFPSPT